MSAETRPISPNSFAQAVEDLPLENIYGKAYEINNSIAHLRQSNKVLQEYSDSIKDDTSLDAAVRAEGDKDCLDAIRENEVVIERQRGRVRLLKAEVERRGQLWHEVDPDDGNGNGAEKVGETVSGTSGVQSGQVSTTSNGNGNANGAASSSMTVQTQQQQQQQQQGSGRLTDEELRRQLENMIPDNGEDGDDDNGGLHL